MLERYTKEASTIQQQVEMRENPNRSNIEPKLNYSINLINNIDSYIRNASVGMKIKLISSMFPEKSNLTENISNQFWVNVKS